MAKQLRDHEDLSPPGTERPLDCLWREGGREGHTTPPDIRTEQEDTRPTNPPTPLHFTASSFTSTHTRTSIHPPQRQHSQGTEAQDLSQSHGSGLRRERNLGVSENTSTLHHGRRFSLHPRGPRHDPLQGCRAVERHCCRDRYCRRRFGEGVTRNHPSFAGPSPRFCSVEHVLTPRAVAPTQLNANENVYGAPAEVIEAIAKAPHHVYPDPSQSELRMAIAAHHGVDK